MRLTFTLAAALLASSTLAQAEAGETRARIDTGRLQGRESGGVVAFKGIPFAAPPVGPLRWRAPQPAAAWRGERDASRYANDCMQQPFPSDAAPLGTPPAEDCLYANVWKPAGAKAKLPVMVWIYGGGFVNGGSSPPTYSGSELAKSGIMVVSFNYRLGRFGTFAHPQLTKQDPDHGLLGNYGYMDQLAALKWVKRNIAAFGGDPVNVTIIGESAGGMSVHTLLTSPMARGTFQKAVVQSGGPSTGPAGTIATAETIGIAFAQSKGIAADDPQALAKLRRLSADQVTDGLSLAAMFTPGSGPRTYSGPVVDGRLAVDPVAAYAAGRFARVPVMIGATSDDIGGPQGYMIAGARDTAAVLAAKGVPTYHYRFSYVATSVRTAKTAGASHATDIPFFFDTAAIKYGAQTSATDRAAAHTASAYLVNFVKTGNPNGTGLPKWPATKADAPAMLDLDAQGGAALIEGD
ncbi:carboxylesterase family protein [Sphingomonas sp. LB2R24]|uniref:carboxylesterase/lipase family protein n=1 Tax=Sphingomonas sorbitolis TaxID=3096165 RepID=UPI002FC865CF